MSNSETYQEVPAAAATNKRQIDSAADFEQQKRTKTENGGETNPAAALAGTGNDQEGNWDCPACGNLNWPKRTVCNRANCNQRRPGTEFASVGPEHPEGSWGCLQCKNVNWPKRTNCNRCQAPKHGGPLPGFGGQFAPFMGGHMNSGGVQHPEGSWACCKCQNINWPLRTACNRCEEPRETADMAMAQMAQMGMQQQQQQYFTPPQLYGAMAAGPQAFAGMPMAYNGAMAAAPQTQFSAAPVSRPASKGGFQHPAGSWDCPSCKNTNWPLRNACNRCKEPKPASAKTPASMAAPPVQQQQQMQYLPPQQQMYAGGAQYAQAGYGGYTTAAAPRMMAAVAPATRADGHPEGSWNCVKCQNVNWPRRTSCNRCQEPKPASAQ